MDSGTQPKEATQLRNGHTILQDNHQTVMEILDISQ
jgi:hypothetical protein